MRILAIDPGPDTSGWALYDSDEHEVVASNSEEPNERLDEWITSVQRGDGGTFELFDELVVEDIESYGMAVGASVFVTCKWLGWFARAWRGDDPSGPQATFITRRAVKMNLCGGMTYQDPLRGTPRKVGKAEIRGAVMERFPETGGGKRPVIGVKKQPGPLFGVSGHSWDALALGIVFSDTRAGVER